MDSLFTIITTLAVAVMALVAPADSIVPLNSPSSVEIGLSELSPAGEQGGYAMPASGESTPCTDDCPDPPTITVYPPIVREGEPVVVTWDPNGNTGCIILGNFPGAGPVTGPGSITIEPEADTTFVIICDGTEADPVSTTIRVLPRIQET